MNRRFILPVTALALGGLVLAGCSGGDDPEGGSTSGGGGSMAEGCEDYADYGVHEGETVQVYSTIQEREADDLVSGVRFQATKGKSCSFVGWKKGAVCRGLTVRSSRFCLKRRSFVAKSVS